MAKEVGLIFYRILGGGKPYFTVYLGCRGVMTGRYFIEILSPFLFEAAEFDIFIAHHIRVGGESAFYGINGVAHDTIPIFVVQGDDFKPATVLLGDIRGDFNIFFGRAVYISVFIFHADTDIENGRIVSCLFQLVDDYGAIYSSRN